MAPGRAPCEDAVMPRYDVVCPTHGQQEVFRRMTDSSNFFCEADPDCHEPAEQIIKTAPYMSVSAEGEDARHSSRVADGSAAFNMALPGVDRVVGKRANGKAAMEYRPITHNELPTKRARE